MSDIPLPIDNQNETGAHLAENRTVLPTEWFYRVKASTRDLVKRAGGLVRAGNICGYSKSNLDRWCSTDHVEVIPIAAALLLESETGSPLVTQAMAEINGRALGPSGSGGGGGGLLGAQSSLAASTGALHATIADANADGKWTANEQKRVDARAAAVGHSVKTLRDEIARAGGDVIHLLTPEQGRGGRGHG